MKPKPKRNQIRQKPGNSQPGSQALKAGNGAMLKASKGTKSVPKKPGGKKAPGAARKQRPYSQ